jgi:hypothetical protein
LENKGKEGKNERKRKKERGGDTHLVAQEEREEGGDGLGALSRHEEAAEVPARALATLDEPVRAPEDLWMR